MKRTLFAILMMSLVALTSAPAFAIARTGTLNEANVAQPVPANKAHNAQTGRKAGGPEDVRRYQAREQSSPNAKNYKGGDVVVISASAVAIVLAIILLIILI